MKCITQNYIKSTIVNYYCLPILNCYI